MNSHTNIVFLYVIIHCNISSIKIKCPHHYHLAVLKERHFHLDFCWIYQLFLASIFCAADILCVQTWLCGRSAIRCASLTAQIITIHHCLHSHLENRAVLLPEMIMCSQGHVRWTSAVFFSFLFVLLRCFLKSESISGPWRTSDGMLTDVLCFAFGYALSFLVCEDVKVKERC